MARLFEDLEEKFRFFETGKKMLLPVLIIWRHRQTDYSFEIITP
jgi:hypothetical protein